MKLITIPLALTVLAASATAQIAQIESLTNVAHIGTTPNWTDNVPNAGSAHGIVDQLNSIDTLQYTGISMVLQPGTYVAAARLMKFQDQTGVADIELLAITGGSASTATLLATAQPTDEWVRTPYVSFSVTVPQPVNFVLQNMDTTILKQNYYFDEITIGRVEAGPNVFYESMTRWGHAWANDPRYYAGEVADLDSAGGIAEHLLLVWWLEFGNLSVPLQPGLYTANVRLKKTVSTAAATDIDLEVRLPSGNSRVTILIADQPVDEYVLTPDVVFSVAAGETPAFWFGNINSNLKREYHFDALIVRSGAYTEYGTECASSIGPVELTATTPVLGEPFTATVENVPPTGGVFAFGAQQLALDLTSIGMPGCSMLASFDAAIPLVPNATNTAEVTLVVPLNASMAGSRFYNQAVVFDPGINTLGLAASNGGFAEISP